MSGFGKTVAGVVAAILGLAGTAYATDVPSLIESRLVVAAEASAVPSAPPRRGLKPFVTVVGAKATSTNGAGTFDSAKPPTAQRTMTPRPVGSPCAVGERHRDVETALSSLAPYQAVTVDGRQSASDCAIIRRFQQRFGLDPADGRADATTADVARRIAASSTPQHLQRCDAGRGVTACVDRSLQTVWVVRDGAVVFGPTVVRTGFRGHATPAGTYRVNKRDLQEWSDPYRVWLPYWQRFVGGIGFHETTTYIHDTTLGSHGCVNLLRHDAVEMWDRLHMAATVRTFGRRPGT